MCGIYGLLASPTDSPLDPALLASMAGVTVHRGPDDEGSYRGEGVLLGMRRLSIIDVAHGHQPIANEDETLWVVCNGEIYNFGELREDLLARGHRFRTQSDTEVLVHLYEEYGPDFVSRLDGMFAFALWDSRRRRLVVVRDRLGVKPLYFRRRAGRLIFASEAKAILALPEVSAEIDPASLEEYLTLGYTPSDRSIFAGIEKLPPASVMVCEAGQIRIEEYWRPSGETDGSLSEAQWAERVEAEVHEAVRAEMISDVPLGAFLSGGIDSSAVVGCMARHSDRPVRTYSIGFDTGKAGAYYNELPFAREVAGLFSTDHKEILVRPKVAELLPKLLWHMDEPVADSAFLTTYLVAEFARRDVTVILSGVGGDEVFGGYRRYLGDYYVGQYHRLPAWLRRRVIAPVARWLPSDRNSRVLDLARYTRAFVDSSDLPFEERYRSYIQVFGMESLDRLLRTARRGGLDSLDQAFQTAASEDGLNRLMNVDLRTQLPNDLLMLTDKMTMAASIECRVPLLNHRLVELGAAIPAPLRIRGRRLKNILKVALADLLPPQILHRRKRGFGAPMGAWLRNELAGLTGEVLSRESVARRGWLDWSAVEQTRAEHETRQADHTDHLLSLINLELWARLYLDGQGADDLAADLGCLEKAA